jgi:hypothetical protein
LFETLQRAIERGAQGINAAQRGLPQFELLEEAIPIRNS